MADKRASGRSLDEWMDLVTECRQSGLTDAAWCNEHGISPSLSIRAILNCHSGDAVPLFRFQRYRDSGIRIP